MPTTIQTGLLTEIIHKYRHGEVIRVLCKVYLKDYGVIDCIVDENEFPIHFLPLLINSEVSVITFRMYLDRLKGFPTPQQTGKKSIDLSEFIPTRLLPYLNQPLWLQAHVFNSLSLYGKGYQSLIEWAPKDAPVSSPRKEKFDQLMMLERLFEESQSEDESTSEEEDS